MPTLADFDGLMPFLPINNASRQMLQTSKENYRAIVQATEEFTKSCFDHPLIPKLIHFIWLGPKPYPDYALETLQEWIQLNPGYQIYLWIDDPNNQIPPHDQMVIKRVGIDFRLNFLQKEYEAHQTYAGKSDILRLELLYEFGGVYTDYDNRCCRNLDVLLHSVSLFGMYEHDTKLLLLEDPVTRDLIEPRISNCILGAAPKHPLFEICFKRMSDTHAFFLKNKSTIQLYQLIIATYVHITLGIAEYLRQNGTTADVLILPPQLAWAHKRGIQVFDHPSRFFEIQYLDSVGWNGEFYDYVSLLNNLKNY